MRGGGEFIEVGNRVGARAPPNERALASECRTMKSQKNKHTSYRTEPHASFKQLSWRKDALLAPLCQKKRGELYKFGRKGAVSAPFPLNGNPKPTRS